MLFLKRRSHSRGNSVLTSPSITFFLEIICPASVTAVKIAFSDDFPELPRSKPLPFIPRIYFDVQLGVSNYILNAHIQLSAQGQL